MADDARYEELFEEPPVFEEPPELERMISNSSSGPGGTRLPRGWKESVDVDGRTVFEHAKSGRREHDRSQVYDMCGTFGCILEDKHQGLHEFANADGLDRSSRTRRAPEASCPADDEGSSRGGLAGGGRARAGRARGRGTGRGSGLRPKPSPPPPQEELFNVEQVLCAERVGSVWRYLVRWKGYDDSNDSWEPEKSLSHCPVLQAYMSRARVQAGSGEVPLPSPEDDPTSPRAQPVKASRSPSHISPPGSAAAAGAAAAGAAAALRRSLSLGSSAAGATARCLAVDSPSATARPSRCCISCADPPTSVGSR